MPDVQLMAGLKNRCDECAVRSKAVCGALNSEELVQLNRIARRRTINRGEIIISDDQQADFFANVLSGVIKLTKTMADGRQQIIGLQFPPDFLGRAFRSNTSYFAEAATDVELCCFPRTEFEQLLAKFPGLEHRLFERTLDELDAAREWMLLLGRKSAEEKVASFLLMLAKRAGQIGCGHEGDPQEIRFALPITRADMADYLGLTIETVSRQITKLKVARVVQILDQRTLMVPDLQRLAAVADLDV